ncbi:MAG: cobalamin-dependent protein [Deltaproteobacteria bacterium]|nr:cobalamin-dependent protein [Deltaproteobacteria bacterium]
MTTVEKRFEMALLAVDRVVAQESLIEAKRAKIPNNHLEHLIVSTLDRIGQMWLDGSVSLSQVYMSGRICEELVENIFPYAETDQKPSRKMAIAVLEDYHMLGKRIVYSMLKSAGLGLLDYGHVEVEEIVHRVIEDDIQILLISTLMLPSALHIKDVRTLLRKSGHEPKIIVGGAPFRFDDQLWVEVGADAMGRTASDAVKIVNSIDGGDR